MGLDLNELLGPLNKPLKGNVFIPTYRADRSGVSWTAVASGTPVVAITPIVDRAMGRGSVVHEAITVDDLAKIPAVHVYENSVLLQKMPDVWAIRRVQLAIDQICDVLAIAIEKKIHTPPLMRKHLRNELVGPVMRLTKKHRIARFTFIQLDITAAGSSGQVSTRQDRAKDSMATVR